jgi:cobalt-zinc-cadmium efflux system outer membrane protein
MLLALAVTIAFVEPSQAPPPALTLAQAVAQARAASPQRGAAVELARGLADAASFAGRLPNPLLDVRVENFGERGRSNLPYDVFAVVSQPLELGGKRDLRRGLAAADRDVAGANLRIAEWQAALRTIQLYMQALKARGLLATLTANRDGLATLIYTMRRRVTEGHAAEADLLKFETESARLDIDIARAGLDLERSLGALAYVIGATTAIEASRLVEPPFIAPPTLDARSVGEAAARHPDVQSAAGRLLRARQALALERARRVPDAVVTGGYKRTSGLDTGVASVTLAVPLFDRNRSGTAKAIGEERAATAERDATALRLASEATALIRTAQTLSERSARASRELIAPADAVRNAARAAFREGTADVLKLIDAERVYADVRRTELEVRLDALAATLEARFAIGEETLP